MTDEDPTACAEATEEASDLPPPRPSRVQLRKETALARQRRRSRRKREVRGRSICVKRLSKVEIEVGRLLFPEAAHERPVTRADCERGARPCPFVSCAHHLYLDVFVKTGAIKLNFPDLEVWEMVDSCALDVADRGGTTLEEAGAMMNLTRERIRQLEVGAMQKLGAFAEIHAFKDDLAAGSRGKRRLPLVTDTLEDDDAAPEDGARETPHEP